MDQIDTQILTLLQEDARIPTAEISRRVGLAASAVFERVKKLEEEGVLLGYTARIEPKALGHKLLAFIFVRSEEHVSDTRVADRLAQVPEVLEVHHIAVEDCYLVKVRARDPEDLGRLLRERFGTIKSIRSTRTTVVLETVKESTHLPIPNAHKKR